MTQQRAQTYVTGVQSSRNNVRTNEDISLFLLKPLEQVTTLLYEVQKVHVNDVWFFMVNVKALSIDTQQSKRPSRRDWERTA